MSSSEQADNKGSCQKHSCPDLLVLNKDGEREQDRPSEEVIEASEAGGGHPEKSSFCLTHVSFGEVKLKYLLSADLNLSAGVGRCAIRASPGKLNLANSM